MKTARSIAFICIALVCAAGLLYAGGQAEKAGAPATKKEIKLSHSHQADPVASEIHYAAMIFQKYVAENSKTLEVKIFAANALGEERAVYEGIQLGGGASCVISGTAILNNFAPRTKILDLAFLWKSYEHAHKVLDGEVGIALAKELDGKGFKTLAWMDSWGFRNVVTSKKEVKNPEDLKGLKIRTIQTPTYVAALNAMGANATPMAFGEVYTAMQTGVLDGFEHGSSVIQAQKFYEVAKYIALTNHLFGPLVMIYSAKEWAKLSAEEQAVVMKGAALASDEQRKLSSVKEGGAFSFLKDKGMIINKIDTSTFVKNSVEQQDKFAAEVQAADLLKIIRAIN